jgi:hypothetical protein
MSERLSQLLLLGGLMLLLVRTVQAEAGKGPIYKVIVHGTLNL